MSCTCEPLFIGCFKHCKQIVTKPVVALMAGTHKFTFRYNGASYCYDVPAVKGAPFIIPNLFIEKGVIEFEAQNPDGSPLTYSATAGGDEYSCFRFKNELGFEIPCIVETDLCPNDCTDDCP